MLQLSQADELHAAVRNCLEAVRFVQAVHQLDHSNALLCLLTHLAAADGAEFSIADAARETGMPTQTVSRRAADLIGRDLLRSRLVDRRRLLRPGPKLSIAAAPPAAVRQRTPI